MRILKEENIKFKYTIVGVDLNEELQFQKAQLELEDDILFIEKLTFEEVVDKNIKELQDHIYNQLKK